MRHECVRDPTVARAVEVSDLVKRYPKSQVNAVDGISFSVPVGEIFGLLGPNGAGNHGGGADHPGEAVLR